MKQTRVTSLPFALRSSDKGKTAYGMVCPYGKWSEPIYGYYLEQFRAGAFTGCLAKNPDIYASIEHDIRGKLIGRSASGTLRLTDSPEGLLAEVDLPNTTYANDLASLLERGDYRGMSFIFDSVAEERGREDSMPTVEITEAKLYEVTFTCAPYYKDTTAGVRSIGECPPEVAARFQHDGSLQRMKQWILENS